MTLLVFFIQGVHFLVAERHQKKTKTIILKRKKSCFVSPEIISVSIFPDPPYLPPLLADYQEICQTVRIWLARQSAVVTPRAEEYC